MLQDALTSLFAQTWPALEVILVDNGSSDGSADTAERCFGDKLTVIRNAKNEGFARGNNIGFNANQRVFATLICSATAPFTQFSTPSTGVALEPNGDFRIDDTLSPTPPAVCASPVLLIRNAAGAWFAAGILKLKD